VVRSHAMKLRIRGDSLRLRLSQGEFATLAEGGTVADAIHFGPGAVLRCEVSTVVDAPALDAVLDGHTIRVIVPAAALRRIAASDEVGLSGTRPIDSGRALSILLEKDFRCLAPRPGDEVVDAFARPDDAPSC
jgi:hypothetical protein